MTSLCLWRFGLGAGIHRQYGAWANSSLWGILVLLFLLKVKALWISKTLSRESIASSESFCALEHAGEGCGLGEDKIGFGVLLPNTLFFENMIMRG